MKPVTVALVCSWLLSVASGFSRSAVLESADRLEQQGRFRESEAVLGTELHRSNLPPAYRKEVEFDLERLDRIRKDFPYTEHSLFTSLQKSVKGLSQGEFAQWIHEGRFETREIDGQRLFMASSVPNLFFRYPELGARRTSPKQTAAVERHHWEVCEAIKAAARAEHKPYVLPKRFSVDMNVTAQPNAAPNGEVIRAWLPVPREYPFQNGFHLAASQPPARLLADERSPIRSVYLEQATHEGRPTRFDIEYEYTAYGVWFDVNPQRVKPCDLHKDGLKEFTLEGPHVAFTPEIRSLSQKIGGSETNSYLKAKRFYEWISENIKYSFAIEYSTIRDISETCLRNGYGDCGQEALLFMTLCRLNGIPARWQSGWNTFPGGKSIHDWCEIYIAPYGWMPVDPYMGIYATQYATSLPPEQRRELRDFYFGGLDQYRMVANSDHSQVLSPPKQSMRSDNVDFQRGELEWGNHNVYFDQFSYELTAEEVPLQP